MTGRVLRSPNAFIQENKIAEKDNTVKKPKVVKLNPCRRIPERSSNPLTSNFGFTGTNEIRKIHSEKL